MGQEEGGRGSRALWHQRGRVTGSSGALQEQGQGCGSGAWAPPPCPEELSSDAGPWD